MNMKRTLMLFLVFALVLGACAKLPATEAPTPTPESGLPTPVIALSQVPDAESAARAYLDAWKSEDYEGMYARLSALSRDSLTLEDFEKQHKNADVAMTMQEMNYTILSSMVRPSTAQVNYEISYTTTLLGTITRSAIINMSLEGGSWQVQWDVSMILPELAGGNKLELTYEIPARGNLYDIYGYPLVAQDDAVALGVIPGQIDPDKEASMLSLLANILGVSSDSIYKKYQYAGADWYVAVGDVSAKVAQKYSDRLTQYPGLLMSSFAHGTTTTAVSRRMSSDMSFQYRRKNWKNISGWDIGGMKRLARAGWKNGGRHTWRAPTALRCMSRTLRGRWSPNSPLPNPNQPRQLPRPSTAPCSITCSAHWAISLGRSW